MVPHFDTVHTGNCTVTKGFICACTTNRSIISNFSVLFLLPFEGISEPSGPNYNWGGVEDGLCLSSVVGKDAESFCESPSEQQLLLVSRRDKVMLREVKQ